MGKKIKTPFSETYILPSNNDEMRKFISQFKIDVMENVIESIKFAIENKLGMVEVFQFKNSPFVVTIAKKEFGLNLEHIHKFYMENEFYELCPKIEKLKQLLENEAHSH